MDAGNQSAVRSAAVDDLWRYYEEHAAQARQHENMRAGVISTLTAIAAAVVGLAGVGGLSLADVPAGLVVILVSVLGVLLSTKHYERNRLHTAVLGEVRGEIDRLRHDPAAVPRGTGELRKAAERDHAGSFAVWRRRRETPKKSSWVVRSRLHLLWLGLPVSIGVVGVLVMVLAVTGVSAK